MLYAEFIPKVYIPQVSKWLVAKTAFDNITTYIHVYM